jgi:ribonuclease J
MIQYTEVARKLGYLSVRDSDIIDAYEIKGQPPHKIVVMCTGSQGEPLSALARMAAGEHRTINIEQNDTVIISATPVPGNEIAVSRVTNALAKINVNLYDKSRALVHVSGHAGSEELKLVLSMVKPKAFLPVHGEASHLRAHADLALSTGVPKENVFICENGESLELSVKGVRRGEVVQSGIVFVDGLSVGDTSQDIIDERNTLSSQGFAIITTAVSLNERKIKSKIHIEMRGMTGKDDDSLCQDAIRNLRFAMQKELSKNTSIPELEKVCKKKLTSLIWERANQRPMIIANLLEV